MKFLVFIHFLFLYSLTGYSQAKKTETLKFKNFKVDIVNFISECSPCSDDVHPLDTLNISENPCDGDGSYIQRKTLKITPKLKNDSFKLSFAYQVDISEVGDLSSSKQENWTYITRYKAIVPIKNNIFKVPKYQDNGYTKSIKTKYGFKDTLVEGVTEGGPFLYRFTKNGKIYSDSWSKLYLRIKRFNNKKLIETKYILVGLTEGCD